jgi:putative transposase
VLYPGSINVARRDLSLSVTPDSRRTIAASSTSKQAWKLDDSYSRLTLTDGLGIGTLRLKGYKALQDYNLDKVKRVRILRRADGYYAQFCIRVKRRIAVEPSGTTIGLDVGLLHFYTDSNGKVEDNPQYYRRSQKQIRRVQRKVSKRRKKGKPQSSNYKKARQRLARLHLRIQRQRKDHAIKLARCVVRSNDLVALENLRIKDMVRGNLAKSINDAGWGIFRRWAMYYGEVYGTVVVAVDPRGTTQIDHESGEILSNKTLGDRVHVTASGRKMSRDHNAAINILQRGLQMVGWDTAEPNAWGVFVSPALSRQETLNQEARPL